MMNSGLSGLMVITTFAYYYIVRLPYLAANVMDYRSETEMYNGFWILSRYN